ncbi:MAG TPA: ACT domain-containing protein, partial [Gemmatirosa sp.]
RARASTASARRTRGATSRSDDRAVAVVRETRAMLAAMSPELRPGEYVFCTVPANVADAYHALDPLGWFCEAEGVSLILERGAAVSAGLEASAPMRCITLAVHSALDGVGLTAAVATALAARGIPANVVAAFHHDHVFVPSSAAADAVAALRAVQTSAQSARHP